MAAVTRHGARTLRPVEPPDPLRARTLAHAAVPHARPAIERHRGLTIRKGDEARR